MSDERDDTYLWDKTGPPDADVARLETLLAPLAHDAASGNAATSEAAVAFPRRWGFGRLAAAAALLMSLGAAGAWWLARSRGGDAPCEEPAVGTSIAVVADGGARVASGGWVEAADQPREIRFGDLGRVTLDPGSRMRVAKAEASATKFFLERGRLEAFVSAAARPRFFSVGTPAAECVDLGCRYELKVDADGVSHVRVLTGQVSFEVPGREVYVPAGAVCLARPGHGPGTPRFEDAAEALARELDRFDGASPGSAERSAAAEAVLAAVSSGRDALPAWHLLGDADARVSAAARARLVARFGLPSDCPDADSCTLSEWRDHLSSGW